MATPKKPAAKKAPPKKPAAPKRKSTPKKEGGGKGLLVGAGIGSAALAAAVLFMTRKKKPADKG